MTLSIITLNVIIKFTYSFTNTWYNDIQNIGIWDNDPLVNNNKHYNIPTNNNIQNNGTQHTSMQHYDTQHNNIQHNNTQDNDTLQDFVAWALLP